MAEPHSEQHDKMKALRLLPIGHAGSPAVVEGNIFTIGSLPESNLCLNFPEISARHARITRLQAGDCFLRDDDSKCGTYVLSETGEPQLLSPTQKAGDAFNAGMCSGLRLTNGMRIAFAHLVYECQFDKEHEQPSLPVHLTLAPYGESSLSGPITVTHFPFTIGRCRDCDLIVPSSFKEVSGRHCRIDINAKGEAILHDGEALGKPSTNGIFVNGWRVESAVIRNKATVRLAGDFCFSIELPETPNSYSNKTFLLFVLLLLAAVGGIFAWRWLHRDGESRRAINNEPATGELSNQPDAGKPEKMPQIERHEEKTTSDKVPVIPPPVSQNEYIEAAMTVLRRGDWTTAQKILMGVPPILSPYNSEICHALRLLERFLPLFAESKTLVESDKIDVNMLPSILAKVHSACMELENEKKVIGREMLSQFHAAQTIACEAWGESARTWPKQGKYMESLVEVRKMQDCGCSHTETSRLISDLEVFVRPIFDGMLVDAYRGRDTNGRELTDSEKTAIYQTVFSLSRADDWTSEYLMKAKPDKK